MREVCSEPATETPNEITSAEAWTPSNLGGDGESAGTFVPIHRRIEAWAHKSPRALALASREKAYSFAELDRLAERVADRLAALGIERESVVAICLPRSVEMVISALGTLKAGGAYLPIDPINPPERIAGMIESSGARVVIARTREGWGEVGAVNVIRVDDQTTRVYVNSEKRSQMQITGTSERQFAEQIFANITESVARLQP